MVSPALLSPRGLFAPEHEYFRAVEPSRSPDPSRKPASPDLTSLPRHSFPAHALENRDLSQLSGVTRASLLEVRPAPETVPTGIAELDALTSGIPRGALTEIFGPASSGRTSVLLALLAEVTRRQEVCALVDVSDSFHPHSAAAAGVDLDRLLWIRCGVASAEYRVASAESPWRHGDTDGSIQYQQPSIKQKPSTFSTQHSAKIKSRHPEQSRHAEPNRHPDPNYRHPERSEGSAVPKHSAFSNQHSVQSNPNPDLAECQPLIADGSAPSGAAFVSPGRQSWERQSENHRNPVGTAPKLGTRYSQLGTQLTERRVLNPEFRALEQALKVTDLLLQSSGFGLIAVDLGDIPPQVARRVPLTSWFRFRRAVENTPTILLVMEQEPYAKTCASLVLKMYPQSPALRDGPSFALFEGWKHAPTAELPTHARLLRGLGVTAELVRSRLDRKPSASAASFEMEMIWSQLRTG